MPPRLACGVPPGPCCCCPVMVTFLWTTWLSGVAGHVPCCCTGLSVATGPFPLWMGMMEDNTNLAPHTKFQPLSPFAGITNSYSHYAFRKSSYGQQGEMQGHIHKANGKCASTGAGSLSDMLWGIKINPTRWWSHYQIKSQLNSVDMRGGIEGRLFPDSAERCDRSIQGKKRGDISDLSPVESKWINPSYRNHSSWLHPSNAKLHYTGTTAARCVPHPPYTPLLPSFCVLRCFVLSLMKI